MKEGPFVPDDELLEGLRGDGLNEAILHIYRQYSDVVYAFIIGNGGNEQDSEDIFQETVVAFIELVKYKNFRGDASIKTLLVSIAKNIWWNEIKKRKSLDQRGKIFETARGQAADDPTSLLYQREITQQFVELFDKLGEPCKTILTLFYYENLSFKEIMQHLKYSNEQVVRNKKYKCMQEITGLVKDNPILSSIVSI